jgi:hypothetical protein
MVLLTIVCSVHQPGANAADIWLECKGLVESFKGPPANFTSIFIVNPETHFVGSWDVAASAVRPVKGYFSDAEISWSNNDLVASRSYSINRYTGHFSGKNIYAPKLGGDIEPIVGQCSQTVAPQRQRRQF